MRRHCAIICVNEVNLIFTVTDKHGHYIPNLQLNDFALLDDQKAPEKVNSFHQQINLPLRVGIVIDASTSIRSRFQFEQQSATEFLLQILKAKSDRAFVMGFDVTPTVDAGLDQQSRRARNRHQPPAPRRRHRALRCRLHCLPRQAARRARGQEPVRKAMILISDGDDNQSRVYPDEAIKDVPARGDHHLRHQHQLDPQPRQGRQSADGAGRRDRRRGLLPAFGGRDVAAASSSIEEELRSQYALTYTPADFKTDGAFRTIYLYCNDRRYQVRAKKGYFAPRQ